ncbi:SIR2 family NAD-dependent protein deacylase [Oxalobacteraceae bacterium A2-2]
MPHTTSAWDGLRAAHAAGALVPYLGPGLLALRPDCQAPAAAGPLADFLAARATLPHRIRRRLSAAAQYIENFKHRKTLVDLMRQAYADSAAPGALQLALAADPAIRLIVSAWYDDAMRAALAGCASWGQVQGLSQSEHFGSWFQFYGADGQPATPELAAGWDKLLYQPLGGHAPADNYLVSDSDYVEVLTEIDIQAPIPPLVQSLRAGRHFLFLGCRFNDQLQRSFARQIIKRSSARHWAVLDEEATPNERRFMAEHGIEQLAMPLAGFAQAWLAPALATA